jgi:hypothetical protein
VEIVHGETNHYRGDGTGRAALRSQYMGVVSIRLQRRRDNCYYRRSCYRGLRAGVLLHKIQKLTARVSPKFEALNPKQYQSSNIQMLKTYYFNTLFLVIWSCLEFRYQDLELAGFARKTRLAGLRASPLNPNLLSQISIGALPLWQQLRCLSPQQRGETFSPHPFKFEFCSDITLTKQTA